MEKILIAIGFICVGFTIGLAVSPIGNQHTEVRITTTGPYTDCKFTSNRLKDGDTFLIVKDGDTLSSGVVVDHQWK